MRPDLEFKRLEDGDGGLVDELAALVRSLPDPKAEYFGLDNNAVARGTVEIWGLYIRGTLCGAAWYSPADGGLAKVPALVLGKEWWKAGLSAWMLQQLVKTTELSGGLGTVVDLTESLPAMGEALEDAEFIGPDREDEGWPIGQWKRMAGWKVVPASEPS